MQLFIDESGSWGKQDRYFVIAMFIPLKPKRIKNLVKNFCASYNINEVKASRLEFPEKTILINKLNKNKDYSISYIVLDKLQVTSKRLLEDGNLCFNFLLSFLLKKTIKEASQDIEIFIDNRNTKVSSSNSLEDYIKIKAYFQWKFSYTIKIHYRDSRKVKLIQMADLIANAIYAKYNWRKDHFYSQLSITESIKFPVDKFGDSNI